MKVKLNRGPANGKRFIQPDGTYQMVIREPRKELYSQYDAYAYPRSMDLDYRTGTYYKSNVKLKDGTCVFEWMGWLE